jgi:cytochrome c-type biogenesis protein CcmH/NrfF
MTPKYFKAPLLSVLFALLMLCGALRPLQAAPLDSNAPEVREVAHQLICVCPDCGHQALDQCPDTCKDGRERRAVIAKLLGEGKTSQQTIVYFADHFGEETVGDPLPRGTGKLAPLVPLLAILGGAIPFALFARSRRPKTSVVPTLRRPKAAAKTKSTSDDARLNAALEEFDY